MSICLVIRVCPLLYFGGRVKYADNFYYGPCPKLKFVYIVVCLFFLMFYCLCFYSYPYFSPSPPTTQPTSKWHCQSPHCCPCPGVLHVRSLTNPYTFFQPVPTSPVPLPAVSLFMILPLWFYFAPQFISFIRSLLQLRSYGICLTLIGLFHLA